MRQPKSTKSYFSHQFSVHTNVWCFFVPAWCVPFPCCILFSIDPRWSVSLALKSQLVEVGPIRSHLNFPNSIEKKCFSSELNFIKTHSSYTRLLFLHWCVTYIQEEVHTYSAARFTLYPRPTAVGLSKSYFRCEKSATISASGTAAARNKGVVLEKNGWVKLGFLEAFEFVLLFFCSSWIVVAVLAEVENIINSKSKTDIKRTCKTGDFTQCPTSNNTGCGKSNLTTKATSTIVLCTR